MHNITTAHTPPRRPGTIKARQRQPLLPPLLALLLLFILLLPSAPARAAARTLHYEYDKAGHLVAQTDELGHTVQHTYDALGRKTASSDSLGPIGQWSWDAVGNLLQETDGQGHTIQHTWDALGRKTASADELGPIAQWSHNLAGEPIEETDGRGITTTYTRDALGRKLTSTRDGITFESLEYDAVGNLIFRSDALGNKEGWQHDARNLITAHNRPLAAITTYQYDAMGQPIREQDPEGRTILQQWDLAGRLLSRSLNDGQQTTHYSYDPAGNLIRTTHPLGNETHIRYNSAHQPHEIQDAAGTSHLGYDARGQLTSRTNALGHTTRYTLDARGQRTRIEHPDGSASHHTWDLAGRLASSTETRHGQPLTTRYEHDARGRQTAIHYEPLIDGDGLLSTQSEYDAADNLTRRTIEDASGQRSQTWQWDAFNRLTHSTDAQGTTLEHQYDRAGRRTHTSAPAAGGPPGASQITTYTWDALDRLTHIHSAGHTTTHSYDRSSRITQTTHSGGTITTRVWDGAGRIQSIHHGKGASTLQASRYEYDANGQRISEEQQHGNEAPILTWYSYDAAARLTASIDSRGRQENYELDAAGNKTTITRSGWPDTATPAHINPHPNGATHLSYDARGQIKTLTSGEYHIDYEWDGSGHLTEQTISASATAAHNRTRTYHWNAAGQLTGIRHNTQPVASYRYNASALRDRREIAGATSHTVWDDDFAFLLQDEQAHTLTRTEHDGLTALVTHAENNWREILLHDGLQSITASVQAQASELQSRSEYDAWGHREQQGNSASQHGYTGHLHDGESGLIYARARYYDPMLGRFISQDPLEGVLNSPITWNAYLYANGSPFVWVDPDGRAPLSVEQRLAIERNAHDDKDAARLFAAACAARRCSASYANGSERQREYLELEKFGGTDEYRSYRERLSSLTLKDNIPLYEYPADNPPNFGDTYPFKYAEYTGWDARMDRARRYDDTHRISVRMGGALQVVEGAAIGAIGCELTAGTGCAGALALGINRSWNGLEIMHTGEYSVSPFAELAGHFGVNKETFETYLTIAELGVGAGGALRPGAPIWRELMEPGGARVGASSVPTSGWTGIAHDSRAVIRDVEAHSGVSVLRDQRGFLADELRQADHTYALSRVDYQTLQRAYNAQRNTLKSEWEIATGQTWPKTASGVDYQAHHIIPQQYGGPNAWWNLHPVPGGAAHQGGVHAIGSPTSIAFPQRPPRMP